MYFHIYLCYVVLAQCADIAERQAKHENRELANLQKTQLTELYQGKNRPSWAQGLTQLNVISAQFLSKWKQFIR